jgi:LysM repeat protein
VSEIETQPNTTTLLGKSTPPADLITINRPKPATTPVVKLADTLQHEKAQPYVETISVNKPAVTETTATTTIPVATQTVTTTPVVTQTIAKADTAHPVVAAEQKQDTTVDELAALKAELDKVVYTDDSKLLNNNPKTTNNTVTPTTKKEEQKTVKEVKETKKKAEAKSKESKYYVIKEGETLGGIANRHDVTVKQLMRWNNIKADQIRAGKKLRVKE